MIDGFGEHSFKLSEVSSSVPVRFSNFVEKIGKNNPSIHYS
jgi:hypothetical protein